MINKLSSLIYNIIIFINKILNLVKKTDLMSSVYNKIKENSYCSIILNKRKISFYTPSAQTKRRIETYFTKEPETIEWINSFQKKESIFWDIGSNIGQYAIYAATKNKKYNIFSFEPSASNLLILTRNISINNLSNQISVVPFGIINKKDKFLYLNENKFEEGSAMHTFGDSKKNSKYKYRVYGTSLNSLILNKVLKTPNYIKIDVDGAEYLVLMSANKFLKNKNIKSILIELDSSLKESFKKCINILIRNNFILKKKTRSLMYLNSKSKSFNYIFERS